MVIIDKGFIAIKYKEALVLAGFTSTQITIEDTGPQSKAISYQGYKLFDLTFQISHVSTIAATVFLYTNSYSLDSVALSRKVEELIGKDNIKIFVN